MTTRYLNLTLTPSSRAVFSSRAATEGAHRTQGCPPGSVLLGWAAAQGRYSRFGDPFAVFHSGQVRFSHAFPLVDGEIAWPMPRLLMEPKHRRVGIRGEDGGNVLAPENLRVGRPSCGGTRHEALKDGFVTASGRVFQPATGMRVRTAIEDGRAMTGNLYPREHLESGASYRAVIEADDIDDTDWRLLCDAFAGRTLSLGKGARTSLGGDYRCEATEATDTIFPQDGTAPRGVVVRVWVLTPLALTDNRGAPVFMPAPDHFGLPPDSRFRGAESAVAVRRFAPWNAHLARRDTERQVIDAGSVLSFEPVVGAWAPVSVTGLYRESGLGRVWIAPPMLQVKRGENPEVPIPGARDTSTTPPASVTKPDSDLISWAEEGLSAERRLPA